MSTIWFSWYQIVVRTTNDNSKKNIVQKMNIKKKWTAMNCFFFIEFFLYLQYLLVRCTNSFYQVLTFISCSAFRRNGFHPRRVHFGNIQSVRRLQNDLCCPRHSFYIQREANSDSFFMMILQAKCHFIASDTYLSRMIHITQLHFGLCLQFI